MVPVVIIIDKLFISYQIQIQEFLPPTQQQLNGITRQHSTAM